MNKRSLGFLTGYRLLLLLVTLLWLPALVLSALPVLAEESASSLKGYIQQTKNAYVIGCGDKLSVHVYHHGEFDQKDILVRCDGFASFNGVGELAVTGKTVAEIKEMLTAAIGELVIDPIVTVDISDTKPGTVYVAGAVRQPGMYQLTTSAQGNVTNPVSRVDLRLSNILSNAGGVKMNADLTRVEIRRGGQTTQLVNLWEMIKEGDNDQDVLLQSGDSVYIPDQTHVALDDENYIALLSSSIGPKTFPVRMLGEVNKPGVYALDAESPYLNSALAQAGGLKEGATRNVVTIRRFTSENDFTTLNVDPRKLDVILRPNDVVVIAEQKMYKAGRYTDQTSKMLSPFTNITSVIFSAAWLLGR
ncbi:MAG: polysaccharide biosynthesis/export family protein [Candidatus Melainabacteria bacterium]